MRISVLQHVPFEGPAAIADWASARGHSVQIAHLYRGDRVPNADAFDFLVVMGGPMSANDAHKYAWIAGEKGLIGEVVRAERPVVGICLGAQMIASSLGAQVYRGRHKEIGWFAVTRADGDGDHPLASLPRRFDAFHWHGETFDLPDGARRLASTEVCENQAFVIHRALGLQFHLESTPASVAALVENCADDIGDGPYEQSGEVTQSQHPDYAVLHRQVYAVLDAVAAS